MNQKPAVAPDERVAGKVPQGNYDFATGAYRRVEGPTNVSYEMTG